LPFISNLKKKEHCSLSEPRETLPLIIKNTVHDPFILSLYIKI